MKTLDIIKAKVGEAFTITKQKTRQLVTYGAKDRTFETVSRNLLPAQVESILENALAGDLHAQWQLFGIMEDSWARLSKNLNEVKRATSRLPWNVQPFCEKGQDPDPQAEERAALVENVLWGMKPDPARAEKDFQGMVYDILDAFAKGISVLEIYWGTQKGQPFFLEDGTQGIRAVKQLPAHYYAYPASPGEEDRLMLSTTGMGQAQGSLVDFPEGKFILGMCPSRSGHPANTALLRTLAKHWIAAQFGFRWLARYAELFGQPIRWATYDPKNQDILVQIESMLENLGSAGWGAFPVGTNLEMKEATGRAADNPQSHLIDLADKACDILILGQTLTTDVGDSGSRALGDTHAAIRLDVLKNAADWAASVINSQVIPQILLMNYGDTKFCPWLDPGIQEPKDSKGMVERDKILFFDMGLPVAKGWLYERHGVPQPGDSDELYTQDGSTRTLKEIQEEAEKKREAGLAGMEALEQGKGSADGSPGKPDQDDDLDDEKLEKTAAQAARVQERSRQIILEARQNVVVDRMVENLLEDITGASAQWLSPVRPLFRDLVLKAQDDSITDDDLIQAMENAIAKMPELFDQLNTKALAEALEGTMGAAAVNGLVASRTERKAGK